ncbi:MAG: redoxin domain-containing protein [Cyclobacteriaceae bacterium]|nr:redoxin domain-containing protein [Cyclobacteriaceae bacterium]
MPKRFILVILFLGVLLVGALQLFIWLNRSTSADELRVRARQLPDLELTDLQGNRVSLETGTPLVLIYFNSECDHCQREIEALKKDIQLFRRCSLVLMSSQPLPEIISFVAASGFKPADSVAVVHVSYESIATSFGQLTLPQIFVYSREGKLVGLFSGETNPAQIAEVIPE